MDNDLNRSLRILEDALTTNRKSLLKTTPKVNRRLTDKQALTKDFNLSLTLGPDEIQYLQQNESMFQTIYDATMQNVLSNQTLTGSIIRTNEPWNNTTDSLFVEFMEIIQARTSVPEVLETVSDFARCCDDTMKVIKSLQSKVNINSRTQNEIWLRNEQNTWRLLFCLYQDRLSFENDEPQVYGGRSEKLCVINLYKRDSLIRESQLVIDWLESNVNDDVIHLADKTVGWENTLHQLESPDNIVFKSSRDIVTRMDPDAPFYQKSYLHDLDAEDEKLLNKTIFTLIRAGKLDEAQKLCIHCGHPWKAAMFEGWRLYHNPNVKYVQVIESMDEDNLDNINDTKQTVVDKINYEGKEIEGNENRDIWKAGVWESSSDRNLDIYEKAALGTFCGNLESILPVCVTWEDYLWAYMKTMVDIRVESEIRDFVTKSYQSMSEEYWNNRMSLNEIFDCLASSKDINIRQEALNPSYIIQKHIILDEIPQLLMHFEKWIHDDNATDQFCRFLAHLILFFKQIGHNQQEDIMDNILKAYINRLIQMNQTKLIAFYTGTLGQHLQVKLYAAYIEKLLQYDERKEALCFAEEAGLDAKAIAKQVVENIRNKPDPDQQFQRDLQHKITDMDMQKISALDWILFYETQRAEALMQVNALIFTYLTVGKIDAAWLAFNKIPQNSIDMILSGPEENGKMILDSIMSEHGDEAAKLPQNEVGKCIREFLCYKAYLDAQEAFSDWYKHFQCKPIPPENVSEGAEFTEKVAHQHRVSQHKADTERWKITLSNLAKNAKTLLYNILLFPDGGWLFGCDNREYLRESCLPEIVLLLFSVLYESGQHEECVQLADILASEKYRLYKVYSKEKLQEILLKLSESSAALLNEKKDPWGNPNSA